MPKLPLWRAFLYFWLLALLYGAMAWDAYVLYSPYQKLHENKLATLDKPIAAVEAALAAGLPNATEMRLEPRGGNNLSIYMRKSDFESVPYPDRGDFVRAIGKAWCDNTGPNSHWFMPSVIVRDIRTGSRLESYDCVLHFTW